MTMWYRGIDPSKGKIAVFQMGEKKDDDDVSEAMCKVY